jgi:SAM-dependent methyltransferase
MNRLSKEEYWSNKFSNKQIPRYHRLDQYNNYRFDKLFKEILPKNENFKILEIGAAHSSWLIYWAQEFHYVPFGIEYTKNGAELGQANLDFFNIEGKLFEGDFFDKDAEFRKQKYNVIFSYGFIEHFDNVEEILIDTYNLLEDDGYVITVVPNIEGIWGKISQKIHPEIYNIHKVVNQETFKTFDSLTGKNLFNKYFGTFFIYVLAINIKNRVLRKIIYYFHNTLKILNITIESKFASPYYVNIFQKVKK